VSAPKGNVLTAGTFELEFKGIALHGYADDIGDDAQWRIASHELDRRDGAMTESMARGPFVTRVELVFAGDTAFADAKSFIGKLEDDGPSGLLVHPIFGKRQATCLGFQGAKLSVREFNTYVMPVTFTENSLDARLVASQQQGTTADEQSIIDGAAAVDDGVAAL
jgi:prophage DNA circulation protein